MAANPVEIGPAGHTVAARVLARRRQLGLSQRDLAARLGGRLAASAISKLETGDRRIDVDDLVVLAAALYVSPAALLVPAECSACGDTPPPGFSCTTCGAVALRRDVGHP